jgi:hypothetical protein
MTQKTFTVKRGTHGLGLFTNVAFKKGDLVTEYTGEKITTDEANRRGGQYLFELNDNWTVDGKDRKNESRYINHSCRPNCYPEIDEKEEHILIYAKRALKVGEELTYDYGKEFWNTHIKPKGCRCEKCQEALMKQASK